MPKNIFIGFLTLLLLSLSACGDEPCVSPNGACIEVNAEGDVQLKLQEALFDAVPGDVIYLEEGVYNLTKTLSLDGTENVTIRGEGKDRTILSYKGQESGSTGILVQADGITLENFAVEDTQGGNDGIVVRGATGVTFRGMRVEWTGGPDSSNGSYGLYPVECTDVLVEDSVVKGASDAGIYVGQSRNVIVRNNRAEYNVAGIEIENTVGADVYGNVAVNNTGGILIFSLPGLNPATGYHTRVFNNEVSHNNTKNFAPGGIVGEVPAGTGIMVLSVSEIEVFDNEIHSNNTASIAIASLLIAEQDVQDMDPYPEAISIHGNNISDGGSKPQLANELVLLFIARHGGDDLPDILWDGVRNPDHSEGQFPDNRGICVRDNGDADFIDLNLDPALELEELEFPEDGPFYDLSVHDCSLPPLDAISIAGID